MAKPSGFPRELRLGPLRITFGALAVGLIALGALAFGSWATGTPSYCGSCHEMRPEFYTWQVSDHKNAGCVQCHMEPGATGVKAVVAGRSNQLREVYKHLTGTYYLPIEVAKPVSNEACLQCHPLQWEQQASGDLKFPHSNHKAAGIACVQCHAGVAHGKLAERQQTIDGVFAAWNDSKGRSNMVRPFRIIGMKDCIDCHSERDVPTTCETCHTKLIKPESHQAANFVQGGEHGRLAAADITSCNKCHSFTVSMIQVRASDPVAQYARNNTFCNGCHKQKPTSHDANWNVNHGARAKDVGVTACQVCHEVTPPKKGSGALAKTYCNQCHQRPHPIPTRAQGHPIEIPAGPPGDSCMGCHSRQVCGKCHTSLVPKVPQPAQQQPASHS